MQQSKPKSAASLTKNDVIVNHPISGREGEWKIGAVGNECRRHVDLIIAEDGQEEPEKLTLGNADKVQVRATVAELQYDVAIALTHITRLGLPPISWEISKWDFGLNGNIHNIGPGDDHEAAIEAWAEWLETEPTFIPHSDNTERGYIKLRGEYQGIPVTITAHSVNRPAEQKAEAKA